MSDCCSFSLFKHSAGFSKFNSGGRDCLPVVEESEDSETEASVEAIEQPFQEDTSGSRNIVSLTKRLFLISLGAAGACKILVALEDGTDEG